MRQSVATPNLMSDASPLVNPGTSVVLRPNPPDSDRFDPSQSPAQKLHGLLVARIAEVLKESLIPTYSGFQPYYAGSTVSDSEYGHLGVVTFRSYRMLLRIVQDIPAEPLGPMKAHYAVHLRIGFDEPECSVPDITRVLSVSRDGEPDIGIWTDPDETSSGEYRVYSRNLHIAERLPDLIKFLVLEAREHRRAYRIKMGLDKPRVSVPIAIGQAMTRIVSDEPDSYRAYALPCHLIWGLILSRLGPVMDTQRSEPGRPTHTWPKMAQLALGHLGFACYPTHRIKMRVVFDTVGQGQAWEQDCWAKGQEPNPSIEIRLTFRDDSLAIHDLIAWLPVTADGTPKASLIVQSRRSGATSNREEIVYTDAATDEARADDLIRFLLDRAAEHRRAHQFQAGMIELDLGPEAKSIQDQIEPLFIEIGENEADAAIQEDPFSDYLTEGLKLPAHNTGRQARIDGYVDARGRTHVGLKAASRRQIVEIAKRTASAYQILKLKEARIRLEVVLKHNAHWRARYDTLTGSHEERVEALLSRDTIHKQPGFLAISHDRNRHLWMIADGDGAPHRSEAGLERMDKLRLNSLQRGFEYLQERYEAITGNLIDVPLTDVDHEDRVPIPPHARQAQPPAESAWVRSAETATGTETDPDCDDADIEEPENAPEPFFPDLDAVAMDGKTPIQIYDLAALRRELAVRPPDEGKDRHDPGQTKTIARLYKLGEAGARRWLEHGNATMLAAIEDVGRRAPHFAAMTTHIHRHVRASINTGTPLRLPPTLIVDEPGTGKTWYLSRLAKALGVPFATLSMAAVTTGDTIQGSHPVWRNSSQGLVSKLLLTEPIANGIVFVDEFDKPTTQGDARGGLYRPYYAALERENARTFTDDFLGIALDASHLLWVLAANEIDPLPDPIRDRITQVKLAPMTLESRRSVACSIYESCNADLKNWYAPEISAEALAVLEAQTPRKMRKAIDLALTYAGADNRRSLSAQDVSDGLAQALAEDTKSPIGFVPHR
jgi:hypothetical protein